MKDEIIELEGKNDSEISIEMRTRKQEMSIFLVKKIIWALDNNVDEFVYAIHNYDGFIIAVIRENFLEALKKNFERMEQYEEYELCSKSNKWINYLKNEEYVK